MIRLGDCLEVMRTMPANSVDAVITDPPYGLEFMGKEWDRIGDIGQASAQKPKDAAAGQSFSDRLRVNHNGSCNLKCRKCGKWQWDYPERKCTCESPDFPNWRAEQGVNMQSWHTGWLTEALRVLKPGGTLFAFGGTRTFHRLVCAAEDAGFEVRDVLMWLYGSGFPKAQDLGAMYDADACRKELTAQLGRPPTKAEFKAAWKEYRVVVGSRPVTRDLARNGRTGDEAISPVPVRGTVVTVTAPRTDLAREWDGWKVGGIKPAYEPILWARKPCEGSTMANVLKHGVGAFNADAGRVELNGEAPPTGSGKSKGDGETYRFASETRDNGGNETSPAGRFPPNLLLDDEAAAMVDFAASSRYNDIPCGNTTDQTKDATTSSIATREAVAFVLGAQQLLSGNNTTAELFLAVTKSTISTLTRLMTALKTSSLWSEGSTSDFTELCGQTINSLTELNTAVASDAANTSRLTASGREARELIAAIVKSAQRLTCANGNGADAQPSRFFPRFQYQAKACRWEREAGLRGMQEGEGQSCGSIRANRGAGYPESTPIVNIHSTVKPIRLMRWLIELVTREGDTVLDPLAGSGSTGCAAVWCGRNFIGIDKEPEYTAIAEARVKWWARQRGKEYEAVQRQWGVEQADAPLFEGAQ